MNSRLIFNEDVQNYDKFRPRYTPELFSSVIRYSVLNENPAGESYGSEDANGNEVMNDYPSSRWDNSGQYQQWFRWIALGDVSINAGWDVPTNSADGHHYDTDELVTWVKGATDKQGVVCMNVRVNRWCQPGAGG
ncbi:hypothetical protein DP804_23315 [Salmonella enterica subsp. enterica]|nr:hypothetical protein [Salmonella enterica subsp. enterica serovar Virchow]